MKTRGELLAAASDAPQRADDRAEHIRAVIASGVAEAYRAPVFTRGFDSFALIGDTIETEHNGYRIEARLEFDQDRKIDDDDCHNEAGLEGCTDEQRAQAMAARAAWFANEWHYVGVVLSVTRNGIMLDEHAASLWGIECNYPGSDNGYLTVVACELLPEALKVAEAALEKIAPARQVVGGTIAKIVADDTLNSITLETMIDAHGLAAVLESLATICDEKAEHIQASYGDEQLAHKWARAARAARRFATHAAVQSVAP